MPTAVTKKGQVTLPKPVRDLLGLEPGTLVVFERAPDGNILMKRADGKTNLSRFARAVGQHKTTMTTEELMALTRGEDDDV